MPMLRIRGIEIEHVKKVSTELVDELSEIVNCPRDYFTLEMVQSLYIMDREVVAQQPLIEVLWFDRGQDIQDQVAQCITKYMSKDSTCLEVFFIPLKENNYYENGTHY